MVTLHIILRYDAVVLHLGLVKKVGGHSVTPDWKAKGGFGSLCSNPNL